MSVDGAGKTPLLESGHGVRAVPSTASDKTIGANSSFSNALDRYFAITARGSNVATECRAGVTAFLATSNNFVVNAQIMSHAGLDLQQQIVAGAFAAGVTCILSGVLSNLPMGLVPSVGPNVFVAYSLIVTKLFSVNESLGISAAAGLLIFLISVSPILKIVLALMPLSIKYGLLVGTGLLTAFIGLKSIGVVVAASSGDIVALGDLNTLPVAVSMISLVVTASMLYNAVKGAVLLGMLGATLVFWTASNDWPTQWISVQSLSFHEISYAALGSKQGWAEVGALVLMLLFSLSGAVIGSARMAGLLREDGRVRGSTAVFVCSGLGTVLSAHLGTAPIFVSMSAAAGIRDGGRTGLVSVVIGVLSLLTAFFLSPLASAIPRCSVAPVLVLVGVSMTGEAKEIQWWNMLDALPAFLCAVFQPFTYSVSNGIYAGVGMSMILFITTGTFIQYFPRLRSKEEDVAIPISTSVKELCQLDEEAEGEDVLPSMMKAKSEAAFKLEELEDNFQFRKGLARIGGAAREEAMSLIDRAASLVGVDAEQLKTLVNERLDAGRNVEAHWNGGLPGFETEIVYESLRKAPSSKKLKRAGTVAVGGRGGTKKFMEPSELAWMARSMRKSEMLSATVPYDMHLLSSD